MPHFAEKAKALKPHLFRETVHPKSFVTFEKDPAAFQQLKPVIGAKADLSPVVFRNGTSVTLDFGRHCVGYLHFAVDCVTEVADSPAMLRFTFGEFPIEMVTPPEDYHGTLGTGWLQNETVHLPFLPADRTLERRFACRYLKIEMLGEHACFDLHFTDLYFEAVTSADVIAVAPLSATMDEELRRIDAVSVETLKECMQDLFEDGPKRDRRLWAGDLRLEAQANYLTFKRNDLVRRCMYLFAAYLTTDGLVPSNVFPDSPPFIRNWHPTDYSLFFISMLYDYDNAAHDQAFLEELYPVALKQCRNVRPLIDAQGRIGGDPFIDWCEGLDKQVAAQGVLIYCLKQLRELALRLNKPEDAAEVDADLKRYTRAALASFDKTQGLFVSGKDRQLSWASQVWMVLAEVKTPEENRALLRRLAEVNPTFTMHTPYMVHHCVEALFSCGMKEEAVAHIRSYWGGMLKKGADCYWEVYNPSDDFESPYLDPVINSGCHAWSSTPAYFIRRYL